MLGVVIGAPLLSLWSARREPLPTNAEEPAGTQIVVQWLDDSPPDSSTRADPLLPLLDAASLGLYVVDSFDLGGGTMNIFLYSDDPERAAKRVVEIFEQGMLPQGMRIGIANSKGEQGTRTYRPVYPADLNAFRLIYPNANELKNHAG
jgi:hypothetical protein